MFKRKNKNADAYENIINSELAYLWRNHKEEKSTLDENTSCVLTVHIHMQDGEVVTCIDHIVGKKWFHNKNNLWESRSAKEFADDKFYDYLYMVTNGGIKVKDTYYKEQFINKIEHFIEE